MNSKKEMEILERAGLEQDAVAQRISEITAEVIKREEDKDMKALMNFEVGTLIEMFFDARDKRVKQAAQIVDGEKKRMGMIESVIIGKLQDSGQDAGKVKDVGSVSLSEKMFFNVLAANREKEIKWFEANEIYKACVHTEKVIKDRNKVYEEIYDSGEITLPDFVKIYAETKLSARKA